MQDISYHKSWKKLSKEVVENEKKKSTPIVTAADNQAKYLQKFGVNFEIPQIDILGSKMFPKDPTYVLQLVHYNCPGRDREKNKTTEPGDSEDESCLDEDCSSDDDEK